MFLTGVWHPDNYLDMVNGLRYTHDLNFGSLSWFWRCKEHQCPLSPNLELWRMLDVPDWGIASWSWFGWVKEPCLDLTLSFHFTQIGRSWDFNFLCLCLCMCMCLCLCPTVILLSQAQMGFGFELWQFFYSHWYLIHMCSTFWLYWFWWCKEHPCPVCPNLGLWRTMEPGCTWL